MKCTLSRTNRTTCLARSLAKSELSMWCDYSSSPCHYSQFPVPLLLPEYCFLIEVIPATSVSTATGRITVNKIRLFSIIPQISTHLGLLTD